MIKQWIVPVAFFALLVFAARAQALNLQGSAGKNVRMVGQIGGGSSAVAVYDHYALIGEGVNLTVLDMSTSPPTRVQNLPLGDIVEDIQVAGLYAYVATSRAGLLVVCVADPPNAFRCGHIDTPGAALACYVSGDFVYVADWIGGLQIIDVSKPTAPRLRGTVEIPIVAGNMLGYPNDVVVVGSYAYLTDRVSLDIIDVSDPDAPTIVTQYRRSWERPSGLDVVNGIAYVCRGMTNGTGIAIINVSDPTSPVLIGQSDLTPNCIAVEGNMAYAANSRGVYVLDVSNPATTPPLLGSYDVDYGDLIYSDLAVSNTFVYVAAHAGTIEENDLGLDVVNVAAPGNPILHTSYQTAGIATDVAVVDGIAFVPADRIKLQVIDATVPYEPTLAALEPGYADTVATANNLVYVNEGYSVSIYDVSNPTQPTQIGSYSGNCRFVVGTTAYISRTSDFQIVNFADPANPVVIGELTGYEGSRGITVAGDMAYLADGADGVHIVDVGNPSSPQYRSTVDTPGYAIDVCVYGTLAYIADDNEGDLRILDVSDPTSPVTVRVVDTRGGPKGLEIVNGRLHVAQWATGGALAWSPGFLLYDIASDPRNPVLVGSFPGSGYGNAVAVEGNLIYLADNMYGLYILEYEPDAPRLQSVALVDSRGNGIGDQGEQVVLTFDRSVFATPVRMGNGTFFFPVTEDDFGGASFATLVNPYNSRQIIVELGYMPGLTPAGQFSMQNRNRGDPSGVDISAMIPPDVIVSLDGISVVDSGAAYVDDTAIDVEFSLVENEENIDAAGGSVAVVDSPDAAYRRHQMIVPAGALSQAHPIRLAAPTETGGVGGAVQVRSDVSPLTFASPATLVVEYGEGDVDWELGQVEGEMRVHQLVEQADGTMQYELVPGTQRLYASLRLVTVELSTLNPNNSQGIVGVFAGLPIETVDERTYYIEPSAGGVIKGQSGFVVAPGPRGAYTKHKIEFPGYVQTSETDPGRRKVTIRKATVAERLSYSGGNSFPLGSGAVFAIDVEDAAGNPVEFTDPVHVTVEFKERDDPAISDCRRFNGRMSIAESMHVAHDRLSGAPVDFAFVSAAPPSLDKSGGTVTVQSVVGLTGPDGKGVFGAVAQAFVTPAGRWQLYR